MLRNTLLSILTLLISTFQVDAQDVHEDYRDGTIFVKVESNVLLDGETKDGHGPGNVALEDLEFLDGLKQEYAVKKAARPFHALQGEAPALKRTYRVHFDEEKRVDELVSELNARSSVDYAEKEPLKELTYSPNDPYYTGGDQWFIGQISSENAWDISTGSQNITVAITDSEIDTAHSDLNGILWENSDEIPGNGVDDDNNGYVDDYRGYDVGEDDPDPTYSGSAQKHGTHVAGLSGAHTDNNNGIASIGFGISIMAVKISDGSGALTAGYDGITYAADQGADVINMSWGGGSSSTTGSNAVSYAKNQGSYLVAAAGNDGVSSKFYPAGYSEVLAVGATNKNDEKASFSNYGSWVDIAAPGTDMNSTWDGDTYNNTQGTSMASPVVAGLAGLMLSHNPGLSHSEITNCLQSTAEPVQGSYSGQLGAGRINAENAMSCVDATVSTAAYDAGVSEIVQPSGTLCDTLFDPTVLLKNYGDSTLNSVDINYRIDNGTIYTQSWSGSLSSNDTTLVTLPTMDTVAGTYDFTAYTTNPNGKTDTVNGNDTSSTSFTVEDGNKITFTLSADCYGSDIGWLLRDTATGQIIDSVGNGAYDDKSGGWTKSYSYCLPDACYEFKITDSYGDGLNGSQYSGCSVDGDYSIVDDETGDTLVDMGSDPDYGSDTSHVFCVPQGPGPPTADFTANQTTIPVGGTVDFTDLSTGNPAPNSWSWTFNGGNPNSSTNQDPSGIQYNTAGTYDVTLTADNGNGTDTETKTDYIEVVPQNADCDTVDQILSSDSPTYYDVSGSCSYGYYPGHSGCGLRQFADSMSTSTLVYLNAVLVPVGKAVPGDPLSSISVKVWADSSGFPGSELASENVSINDLTEFSYNKVHFSSPAQVDGDFFIGYEVNYGNGDTVTFLTAQDRGTGSLSTSFWNDGSGWNSTESTLSITTSMYTRVLVSTGQPSADFDFFSSNICYGDSTRVDGSSSINVRGWQWISHTASPDTSYGDTSAMYHNSRGTHDVKLKAYGSCTVDSTTEQVSVKSPVFDSIGVNDASDCGTSDGEIHVFASNGFAPYEYSIDSGASYQGSNDFTGLSGGVYDVVVKDDNGCTTRDTVHVQPITGVDIDNVDEFSEQTCNGNDGKLVVHASSGATPYDYSIDAGASYQTDSTFTGLSPGTYDVQVKDDNGCIDATTAFVDSLVPPDIDAVNVTDVQTCGGNDGEIEVQASGGTSPYRYSIDSGASYQSNNKFTGLAGGGYDVIVKDDSGCTAYDSVYVEPKPSPALDSIDTKDVSSCSVNDGEIEVFAIDGTTPYEYSIDSGASYQGSAQFTGLADGIYDVMVRDANGCVAHDTAHINAPDEPSIDSVTVHDLSCNGSGDGEIRIHASNTDSYSIDDGANYQASNSFSGLSAGTYKLKVKNASGCKDSGKVTVSEPKVLAIDSVAKDTAYCGNNTGALSIHASGGSSPYSYSIDNGSSYQGSKDFTGLSAGSYDIVVKDDSGCTTSLTDNVPGSSSLNVSVSTTDDSCNTSSGSATANVSGGSSPYSYDWSNGASGQSISGLSKGTYHVVVTDPNGCKDSVGFSIYNNGSVSASVTPQKTTICEGDTVTLKASGGTSYEWEDESGTIISTNSSVDVSPSNDADFYAKVTDGGCSEFDTSSVIVDSIPNTKVDPKDTSICEGDSVTLIASGAPSYQWNTGSTTASITVSPSTSTTYNVTGINGSCTGNTVFTQVTVGTPPNAVANANDTVVALVNGATVQFDNAGSTGASFKWDFGDGTTANVPDTSHSYGTTGTFDAVLTAYMNGCVDRDTITIHVNETNTALRENDGDGRSVSIHPNPNSGRFRMEARFSEKQDLDVEIINSVGKTVRKRSIEQVKEHRERFDLSDRSTGIYYVRVRNENGVSVHKVSVIR